MLKINDVKVILKDSTDIVYLDLYINHNHKTPACLIYIEGLVNTDMIDAYILKPLMQKYEHEHTDLIDLITHSTVYHCARKVRDSIEDTIADVLSGNAALIIDNLDKAIVFEVKGFQMRSVSEPTSENVVKGAKDSFIEVLRVNTATVRRRIQSTDLCIKEIPVGTDVKTNVAVIYLNKKADPEVVQNILRQIQNIKLDAVKSPGNIEENIVDHKYSIFPQTVFTERPDRLCANIVEGKIGILIDGYPIAYIVPIVFNMLFQSAEDYSFNYLQGSIVRSLRYICAFFSLVLPGFYVSIVTFHHEMLPTSLLSSLIKSKESVPIASLLEVIFMLIAFEILIEAGVRLPSVIGQAVSIVGGLVVGEAAVNAKFISPTVVVVIAIAGICGFIIPNHSLSNAFRFLRMIIVLISGFTGLYGLSLTIILIFYYACTMYSKTSPMMASSYPHKKNSMIWDGLFRWPTKRNKSRTQK